MARNIGPISNSNRYADLLMLAQNQKNPLKILSDYKKGNVKVLGPEPQIVPDKKMPKPTSVPNKELAPEVSLKTTPPPPEVPPTNQISTSYKEKVEVPRNTEDLNVLLEGVSRLGSTPEAQDIRREQSKSEQLANQLQEIIAREPATDFSPLHSFLDTTYGLKTLKGYTPPESVLTKLTKSVAPVLESNAEGKRKAYNDLLDAVSFFYAKPAGTKEAEEKTTPPKEHGVLSQSEIDSQINKFMDNYQAVSAAEPHLKDLIGYVGNFDPSNKNPIEDLSVDTSSLSNTIKSGFRASLPDAFSKATAAKQSASNLAQQVAKARYGSSQQAASEGERVFRAMGLSGYQRPEEIRHGLNQALSEMENSILNRWNSLNPKVRAELNRRGVYPEQDIARLRQLALTKQEALAPASKVPANISSRLEEIRKRKEELLKKRGK